MARPDEPLLRKKLRELSQRSGVLRDDLYDFLGQRLRASWHIESSDPPGIVLAKVIWQLGRLISELQQEEHRIVARYCYNITGIEAVERLDLGERQKELAKRREQPNPSARASRGYMAGTILPRFETSLDERPAPAVPAELLDTVRERFAQGERVPAIMRELLDGTPPQPPPQPSRRRRTLMAAVAAGGLALILGATLVLWGATRDQPTASGDQNGPTATSAPGTGGPVVTGETFTEECYNSNGCRVFEDPYGSREQPRLEFMQEVEVSCRVYAPSMPSVEWWYRLASEPYNNEWWSPAVTYLNGDPPEGPYERDVDEAVPEC
jgi:hypothetical protein